MDDIINDLLDYADFLQQRGEPFHLAARVNRRAADNIAALRERQRELLDRIHRLNEDLLEWQDKDRRRLLNERYGN